MHQTPRPGGGSAATAMTAAPDHDPAAAGAVGSAEPTRRLKDDHDRIAAGIDVVVTHRLFAVGLSLQTALGLLDGHQAGQSIHDAIAELDQAISDLRDTVFGTRPTDPPRSGTPG
jgi:signal transduction histidine kinase